MRRVTGVKMDESRGKEDNSEREDRKRESADARQVSRAREEEVEVGGSGHRVACWEIRAKLALCKRERDIKTQNNTLKYKYKSIQQLECYMKSHCCSNSPHKLQQSNVQKKNLNDGSSYLL